MFTFAEYFLQINFISLDALSRNSEQIKLSEFLKRNKKTKKHVTKKNKNLARPCLAFTFNCVHDKPRRVQRFIDFGNLSTFARCDY